MPSSTQRISLLFHIVDFIDGGIESSLIQWLRVFDRSRLLFDRVTAESGGGQLILSGSLSYAETPMRYQISAETPQVRVRYPPGMSWLIGGSLQLAGTQDAAVLSGRIQVQVQLHMPKICRVTRSGLPGRNTPCSMPVAM